MELLKVKSPLICHVRVHGSVHTGTEFEDPDPAQLDFNVGSTSACTVIRTMDDVVHEDNETFSVALSSTSERISFTVGTATVQIIDDDSKRSMH